MRTIKELAKVAADKVRNRNHWTTEVAARDVLGDAINPRHRDAVRWCAIGACEATMDTQEMWALRDEFCKRFGIGMSYANDRMGHRELIEFLDALAK